MTYFFYISNEWDNYNKKDFIVTLAKLKKDDKFIVINRPLDFTSYFLNRKKYNIKLNEINEKSSCRKIENNLFLFRPKILFHDLIGGKFFSAKLNYIIFNQIYKQLIYYGLLNLEDENITLWLYSQIHWKFVNVFDKHENVKVIWEIYDDYRLTAQGNKRRPFINAEPNLICKTDIIFTLTNGLKDKYKDLHSNIHVIGNGFDKEKFNYKLSNKEIKNEIETIPKPRIAYIGLIRNWIDFELLSNIIDKRKDWSFIFIGDIDSTAMPFIKVLSKKSNVYIKNRKDKTVVGIYMKYVDIGLIPYIKTEFTMNVKPIKLFEFLASGTPVVTSTIADIKECEGSIYIYNKNNIEEKIESCLVNSNIDSCIKNSIQWEWFNLINKKVIPNL